MKHSKPTRGSRYEMTQAKFLTTAELSALQPLLEDPSSPHRLIFRLLLETGARVSELLLLEVSDVDHATKAVALVGLKDSRDRVIPLADETYSLLLASMPQQGPIFSIKKRRVQRVWEEFYRPRLQTTKGVHSLRHTFGILLYKRCKDIQAVQQALGHVSIDNTMVYARWVHTTEDLREAFGLKAVV